MNTTQSPPPDGARPGLLIMTPSADGYGSDRALVGLLPELTQRFDVTMLAAADGPMLAEARAGGAEVILTPDWALRRRSFTPTGALPAAGRLLRTLWLIRRLQRQRSFALLYANTVANTLIPFLRLASSAPLVVHVREVPRTGDRMNRLFFGQISRVAERVICNSTHTESFVCGIAPGLVGRTEVIHDGVDPMPRGSTEPTDRHPSTPIERIDETDETDEILDIVCVGRIHPQKGQQVLVDALGLGTADGRRWRCHFWGDALDEHRHLADQLVARVTELGVQDRVRWHGYSNDRSEMYGGMDVAVIPSTWPEGFSLVTAEGSAAGLPVIATRPGGPTDIVDDGVTGRLVDMEDPAALRDALVELEDADLRRRWGRAGIERFEAMFTTERSAKAVARSLVRVTEPGGLLDGERSGSA